jgi:hypothetical protein
MRFGKGGVDDAEDAEVILVSMGSMTGTARYAVDQMRARGEKVGLVVASAPLAGVAAEKKYGPGVTDTEIKLGQTEPYSGPVTALSMFAKAQNAYIAKINAEGGINGRKINLISLDDAYAPPKTVEQTRRLEGRIDDGRKIWKLSPMDLESYDRWDDYTRARDEMFAATDTLQSRGTWWTRTTRSGAG